MTMVTTFLRSSIFEQLSYDDISCVLTTFLCLAVFD